MTLTPTTTTIYPIGHPVAWRRDIDPRIGTQRGKLAREWEEHTAALVLWNGESVARSELPECIEVQPLANEPKPALVAVGNTSAWENYRPAVRRARR